MGGSEEPESKGPGRVKGDERILGDGDFVISVLSEADERLDHG